MSGQSVLSLLVMFPFSKICLNGDKYLRVFFFVRHVDGLCVLKNKLQINFNSTATRAA